MPRELYMFIWLQDMASSFGYFIFSSFLVFSVTRALEFAIGFVFCPCFWNCTTKLQKFLWLTQSTRLKTTGLNELCLWSTTVVDNSFLRYVEVINLRSKNGIKRVLLIYLTHLETQVIYHANQDVGIID